MDTPCGAIAHASDSGTGSNAGVSRPIRAIEPTPSRCHAGCGAAANGEGRDGSNVAAPTAVTLNNCLRFIRDLPASPLQVRPTLLVLNRSTQQSGQTLRMVSSNLAFVEGGCSAPGRRR